jgi:hypothetical protein
MAIAQALTRARLPFGVIGWHYINRPCEFLARDPRNLPSAANGPVYLGKGRP